MATRRAPSKPRNAPNAIQAPIALVSSLRPRSALSRPAPSVRSDLSTPEESFEPSSSLATSSTSSKLAMPRVKGVSSQDGSESNIQVVIRCRRRSEREIQENSPIIVASSGPRGQEVTIETAAPTSVLGLVTLPPTRTYPFDLVFGPEADQAIVYQDVVHPMLDEVLKGYNCTLFAYGQTGTGKTYTMQGDVSLTPLGNPTSQAGMIPRVLFKLFHQLEESGSDYSVKISYVELYNEELRDLLATELSAPINSVQPMAMGGNRENQAGLKIFDDASKKGVFIQGLEETSVKDFRDALALLSKGSHRRQIAATKFNDHSSRSHSVFSITVHCKETSSLGDDLLKVGKLNLVDLAGSENIGRSGAENKRAREAGMINQSLLTLGRVINALVDRSSHVPYRESKLTRLLQDSLGGRTKTCIIATVSPARSNMEETLSTLDYAIRAKSIRNKPEVNQRMTRNALLKEYVTEIERLKSDVLAAREKNGIYFSEETWTQLSTEHELRQTEVEEAKKHMEIVESQMRAVREEFEQSIALFLRTDSELKQTRETLRQKEGELHVREEELRDVQVALEEEVVVRQMHASNELVIDGVAGGLKKAVSESTGDVAGLFLKLDRKAAAFESNRKAASAQSKLLDTDAQSCVDLLNEFVRIATHRLSAIQTTSEDFKKKELDALSTHSNLVNEQLGRIQDSLGSVQANEQISDENLASIRSAVKEAHESITKGFSSWSVETMKSFEAMCVKVEESGLTSCAAVEQAMTVVVTLIDELVREARDHVDSERKAAQQHGEAVSRIAQEEISRLQAQNATLLRLLETEKEDSVKARDDLVKRVSSMLVDYSEQRDQSLRQVAYAVKGNNEHAIGTIRLSEQDQLGMLDTCISRGRGVIELMEKTSIEAKKATQSGFEGLRVVNVAFNEGLTKIHHSTVASIKKYSTDLAEQAQEAHVSCSGALERADRAKRARIETTTSLGRDAQSGFKSLQRCLSSTSRAFEALNSQITSEAGSMINQTQQYSGAATSLISSVQKHNRVLLEHATREDSPTGTTPQKRVWDYVDRWEVTGSRDSILKNYREQRNAFAGNSPTARLIALPPFEADEDGMAVEDDKPPGFTQDEGAEPRVFVDAPQETEDESTPTVTRHGALPQIPSCGPGKNVSVRTLKERSTNIASRRGTRSVR